MEVFRIIDKKTGEAVGSYSRACHDEYDFGSVESARSANCHGTFENRKRYRIAKYRVIYELIEPDCDKGSMDPDRKERAERLKKMTREQRHILRRTGKILEQHFKGLMKNMAEGLHNKFVKQSPEDVDCKV